MAISPLSAPVVAGEVVVRRVLAAEHGAGLGHDLLDERVTDLGAHRHAAVLADDLGHGARADQVVQHGGARLAAQDGGGEDRRRRRAGQPDAQLVDDEHAVGVAVEGQADVEAAGLHPGPQVALVGRLQRVGRVVRERAVELAVHHLELDHAAGARRRPARRDRPCRWPCRRRRAAGAAPTGRRTTATWSTNSGSRSASRRAPAGRRSAGPWPSSTVLATALISPSPSVADRAGALQAHLHAVVLGRVVRGGEDHARAGHGDRRRSTRGRTTPARCRRRRRPGSARRR